ncbi:TolC family protein [Salmonella enterica subsp. enterica serovar Montevideo]|uniref:TolC family protein n=1 Tax=Salmonella enterica TaxID=28901 RepID=A0A620CUG0_SALER|nr:TolC family protein [Salmonella enterica]EAA8037506.1 TolC family protein [Salmonella enterica subsp. enterica serovar Duisburg]EAQ4380294.1 TolC family protein [Salmonella enterica subsp. enterica serovar Javiana]EAW2140279.1 TolC family protein [Salmonella enterica subsp. enterica]EBI0116914.1 TolC family protein [Salmonella enterica subsp. enterica serovar Oranienburg]EBW4556912.1 TolC family protein [Salmonella enterica subsp. enterica serovar Anatum]ECH8011255.1 TolC family protein [S
MNKLFMAFVMLTPIFPCYAMDYNLFMRDVYKNSDVIKSKLYDLESEKNNASKTDFFYAPKVKLNNSYKNDSASKKYFDNTINVNSLLFDSSISNRFKEKNARLSEFELSVLMEKEKLAKLVIENAISISQYQALNSRAHTLDDSARQLWQQINNRYINGTASQSDLQQADLLVQRIEGDIRRIEQEIKNFQANIEIGTGLPYPEDSITLNAKIMDEIKNININKEELKNNFEYLQLSYQAEETKQNAEQQNSLLSVSLVGEDRRNNHRRIEDDSYVGVSVDLNIFDFDKVMNKQQKINQYKSTKARMDQKYKELTGQLKLFELQYNSSEVELKNYLMQLETTKKIIESQRQEYNIAKISYYEMLNTEFDYFQLQEKIADQNIKKMSNRLSVLALLGRLIKL